MNSTADTLLVGAAGGVLLLDMGTGGALGLGSSGATVSSPGTRGNTRTFCLFGNI